MKRILFLCVSIAFVFGFAGASVGADNDHGKVKAKFYEFPTLDIEGGRKAPTAIYSSSRKQVEFGRLLKLKKSMLPELRQSGRDSVLK